MPTYVIEDVTGNFLTTDADEPLIVDASTLLILGDSVLDGGLTVLDTGATHIEICSAQPLVFSDIATYRLGSAACSIGAPAATIPKGRKVAVASTLLITITATGVASWWAISDRTGSRLLAKGTLPLAQAVVSGASWTLSSFEIALPSG
jgi:hypothetical protein